MHDIAARLTTALAALAALTTPLAAQDVAGTWLFRIDSTESSGAYEIPVTFEQDGSAVTGTVDLTAVPRVGDAEISDGRVEDGELSFALRFLLQLGQQSQWFTVRVEADVRGDEMVGEAYMPEMDQSAPFTARRSPRSSHGRRAG